MYVTDRRIHLCRGVSGNYNMLRCREISLSVVDQIFQNCGMRVYERTLAMPRTCLFNYRDNAYNVHSLRRSGKQRTFISGVIVQQSAAERYG